MQTENVAASSGWGDLVKIAIGRAVNAVYIWF